MRKGFFTSALTFFFASVYAGWWIYAVIAPSPDLVQSLRPSTFPNYIHIEPLAPTGEFGVASWYNYSLPGYPDYSKTHYTAASRDFPRWTILKVCVDNITLMEVPCVIVRVNDYIEHPERAIDLSSAAFEKLAPLKVGLINVSIEKYEI